MRQTAQEEALLLEGVELEEELEEELGSLVEVWELG